MLVLPILNITTCVFFFVFFFKQTKQHRRETWEFACSSACSQMGGAKHGVPNVLTSYVAGGRGIQLEESKGKPSGCILFVVSPRASTSEQTDSPSYTQFPVFLERATSENPVFSKTNYIRPQHCSTQVCPFGSNKQNRKSLQAGKQCCVEKNRRVYYQI